eukprot:TRINITY_DN5985_c0_g1_i2.p1 TRINITY_DN5985_c0_g1~~TRINITY_DN5985_c0_g1_i2.p1  ORF type:complete len:265 (-),score=51.83 TRINITY_DN5985_c0_g1_i2:24-818(-)
MLIQAGNYAWYQGEMRVCQRLYRLLSWLLQAAASQGILYQQQSLQLPPLPPALTIPSHLVDGLLANQPSACQYSSALLSDVMLPVDIEFHPLVLKLLAEAGVNLAPYLASRIPHRARQLIKQYQLTRQRLQVDFTTMACQFMPSFPSDPLSVISSFLYTGELPAPSTVFPADAAERAVHRMPDRLDLSFTAEVLYRQNFPGWQNWRQNGEEDDADSEGKSDAGDGEEHHEELDYEYLDDEYLDDEYDEYEVEYIDELQNEDPNE